MTRNEQEEEQQEPQFVGGEDGQTQRHEPNRVLIKVQEVEHLEVHFVLDHHGQDPDLLALQIAGQSPEKGSPRPVDLFEVGVQFQDASAVVDQFLARLRHSAPDSLAHAQEVFGGKLA